MWKSRFGNVVQFTSYSQGYFAYLERAKEKQVQGITLDRTGPGFLPLSFKTRHILCYPNCRACGVSSTQFWDAAAAAKHLPPPGAA